MQVLKWIAPNDWYLVVHNDWYSVDLSKYNQRVDNTVNDEYQVNIHSQRVCLHAVLLTWSSVYGVVGRKSTVQI